MAQYNSVDKNEKSNLLYLIAVTPDDRITATM